MLIGKDPLVRTPHAVPRPAVRLEPPAEGAVGEALLTSGTIGDVLCTRGNNQRDEEISFRMLQIHKNTCVLY